jgi:hypothetical protein
MVHTHPPTQEWRGIDPQFNSVYRVPGNWRLPQLRDIPCNAGILHLGPSKPMNAIGTTTDVYYALIGCVHDLLEAVPEPRAKM